jgi:isocitrate lyase
VEQFAYNGHLVEDFSLNTVSGDAYHLTEHVSWRAVQRLTDAGASAIGLVNGLLISHPAGRRSSGTLIPINQAIRQYEAARTVAESMNNQLVLCACTNACDARVLTTDDDPRDRRHLTGMRSIDGSHVYCGSIDAAVSRALVHAPYADVICYRTASVNLHEAQHFASVVRASFPNKPLGICFPFQVGPDGASLNGKLVQLGYHCHFLTLSESYLYPGFTQKLPWALFDDGVKTSF